jgi:hypothetical protein
MLRRVPTAALALLFAMAFPAPAQAGPHSIAREWNEAMLRAIRKDFARPVVQARNLFHLSAAMYDAWAAYDATAATYLLRKTVGGYTIPFNGIARPADTEAARREAISYAAYRIIRHRFRSSPPAALASAACDSLMSVHGYDPSFTSTDYASGSPAALGNYIGTRMIAFGLQDGSNEANDYAYEHYQPVNRPVLVMQEGDTTLDDPNRWQPLTLSEFVDQNGNHFPGNTPRALGPEWGAVTPFALTPEDRTIHTRNSYDFAVYHDPGPCPQLDTADAASASSLLYQWGFVLVALWSSHLSGSDPVNWDISPGAMGNLEAFGALPDSAGAIPDLYRLFDGGSIGRGRPENPFTGRPYEQQIVPRGDYARTIAEFWADGPTSETPPGHWFAMLNMVDDHPSLQRRIRGTGPVLGELEWDVKSYFALGGAVHDAAIAAWGVKGWYDGVRPVSAIRWMAGKGQSTDPNLPHYSSVGLPLIPGYIELIGPGDPLAGSNGEYVNKIKLYAWRGHAAIPNPATTSAGTGWVIADAWWPYQRQSFVTPPFPGYVSGHSTFSRASAELLTLLTGSEYFPGGLAEFTARHNEFLVFEDGPSVDVTLQWATYRDAAEQSALSRIWGGIHSPLDDIPGRRIGAVVGARAFALAERYFTGEAHGTLPPPGTVVASAFPNPVGGGRAITVRFAIDVSGASAELYSILGQLVATASFGPLRAGQSADMPTGRIASGVYFLRMTAQGGPSSTQKVFVLR